MKPISIRFKCFGPYMAEQYIDFAQLEKNGLFLICGETGSGKTTILDAMCYALYGRSSGGIRGDLTAMRCKLAGKHDETLVEFVFDCDGQRYKFVRSLKMARKNLNDSHNCMIFKDGVYVPILENPKVTTVNKEAERIVGLTYDQFRQVIILPQGQFEKLLVSDSAEKEKILVSLFHAEQWQDIADEIGRRVTAKDNVLKQERAAMSTKLSEYGVSDLPGLREKLSADTVALEVLQQQVQSGEEQLGALKQRYEQALLENKDFEELERREKVLSALEPRTAAYDAEERRLGQAEQAERIRPRFDAYQAAAAAQETARWQLRTAQQKLSAAEEAQWAAERRRANHEGLRPVYEQQKRDVTLLENARELYRTLTEKKTAADRAAKQQKQAELDLAAADKQLRTAEKAWQAALGTQNEAIARYAQAQSLYLAGIGSVLAEKLVPGAACPVCGSVEHPDPAKPAPGHISEAELEAENQAVQAAGKAVTTAHQNRMAADQARSEAQNAYMAVQQAAAGARTEYESALSRKIDGIDTAQQLEITARNLKQDIAAFESAEQKTAADLVESQGNRKAAAGLAESAEAAVQAASQSLTEQLRLWQTALQEAGLADEAAYLAVVMEPEEKQRRQTALIRFRTDLANARTAAQQQRDLLEGREKPDVPGLKQQHRDRESAQKQLNGQYSVAVSRLETMRRDAATLAKRKETYDEQRVRVDADLEFARRLQGRTGVSLQRYVLGVMLTSITAAANRLLKNVHGGRYQLYRTDQVAGSGHKSGLELEVYDARNNERRSVTTLSGGEKFLVALSLAIGLSTVVQAQGGGIRLEAMFIDEGFGSLDSQSINDALEVLQGIRRSSGVVGIISHVEQLAETIPTQIHIIKGEHGSRCEICL